MRIVKTKNEAVIVVEVGSYTVVKDKSDWLAALSNSLTALAGGLNSFKPRLDESHKATYRNSTLSVGDYSTELEAERGSALGGQVETFVGLNQVRLNQEMLKVKTDGPSPSPPPLATGSVVPAGAAKAPENSTALTTPTDRPLEILEFLSGHAVLKFDPGEWKRFTTGPGNLQLVHLDGDVYFRVVTDGTLGAKDERLIQQSPRTINGVRVVSTETEATIGGVLYAYYSFTYSGPIGTVRLVGFTSRALMSKYRPAIERLASGFEFTGRLPE